MDTLNIILKERSRYDFLAFSFSINMYMSITSQLFHLQKATIVSVIHNFSIFIGSLLKHSID